MIVKPEGDTKCSEWFGGPTETSSSLMLRVSRGEKGALRGANRCVGASKGIAEGIRLLGDEGRGRGLAVVAVLVRAGFSNVSKRQH
jgi:hypothetical protein